MFPNEVYGSVIQIVSLIQMLVEYPQFDEQQRQKGHYFAEHSFRFLLAIWVSFFFFLAKRVFSSSGHFLIR